MVRSPWSVAVGPVRSRGPHHRDAGGSDSESEGDRTAEAEVGVMPFEDGRQGPRAKECTQPLAGAKGKEVDFPPEPS